MRRHFARFLTLSLLSATIAIVGPTTQSAVSAQAGFSTNVAKIQVIHAIYEDFLGRRATDAEIARFLPRLGVGQIENDVRAKVLASRAFFRDRAGKTRDGYVRALYREVRGRAPTSGELTRGKQFLFRSTKPLVARREALARQVLAKASFDPDGIGITELVLHKNAAGDIIRFAFEVDADFAPDDVTLTVSIKGSRIFGSVRVRSFENLVSRYTRISEPPERLGIASK